MSKADIAEMVARVKAEHWQQSDEPSGKETNDSNFGATPSKKPIKDGVTDQHVSTADNVSPDDDSLVAEGFTAVSKRF